MIGLLLFDVADPVSSVGIGVLIVLAIVVLAIVAVLISGFVFLLVRHKRRNANGVLANAALAAPGNVRLSDG
jgi:hypothetical protein